MSSNDPLNTGIDAALREPLAELAHKRWSGWMRYLFDKSLRNADGTVTIPEWAAQRWHRQMETPYSELPEAEKGSDRAEAERIIAVINEVLS